jgi:hypothetical protein
MAGCGQVTWAKAMDVFMKTLLSYLLVLPRVVAERTTISTYLQLSPADWAATTTTITMVITVDGAFWSCEALDHGCREAWS